MIPLLNESWYYWADHAHSPYFNMAADEMLLLEMPKIKAPVLRIYLWDCPSFSIGFAQTWTPRPGYTAVRRLTGGGVVFHDVDLTYTLVFPVNHSLAVCSREMSYAIIHKALADVLEAEGHSVNLLPESVSVNDHAHMQCFVSPSKFDVMDGAEKAAGAAQRRTKEGVLHQGSVKLSVTHGDIPAIIKLVEHAFASAFKITYAPWEPSPQFLADAETLGLEKYASEMWSLRRRAPRTATPQK